MDFKFEWKPEQEDAFQHLKAKLASQPIFQYLDFSKEFTLPRMPVRQVWEQYCPKGHWGKICQLLMLVEVWINQRLTIPPVKRNA